jgi:hypothetical protein
MVKNRRSRKSTRKMRNRKTQRGGGEVPKHSSLGVRKLLSRVGLAPKYKAKKEQEEKEQEEKVEQIKKENQLQIKEGEKQMAKVLGASSDSWKDISIELEKLAKEFLQQYIDKGTLEQPKEFETIPYKFELEHGMGPGNRIDLYFKIKDSDWLLHSEGWAYANLPYYGEGGSLIFLTSSGRD